MTGYTKCTCPHCANNIEFGPERSGMEIQCPHCDDMMVLPALTTDSSHLQNNPEVLFKDFCPHCDAEIEAPREWRGMELPCPLCEKPMRFAESNDELLSIYEDLFLRGGPLSDYKGEPFEFSGLAGLVGCLAIPVVLAAVFAIFGAEAGFMVLAICFIAAITVPHIRGMLKGRYVGGRQYGRLRLGSLQRTLGMGDKLKGRAYLEVKQPLQDCSIGVSLMLSVFVRGGGSEGGGEEIWLPLCQSRSILVSHRSFLPGSEHDFDFSIIAPIHQPSGADWNLLEGILTGRNLAGLDSATLLKKRQLTWSLNVVLFRGRESLLQTGKGLRVRGNSRTLWRRIIPR